MSDISVDTIIVNYNSTEYALRCIESVQNNVKLKQIRFIVVDNNSNDTPEKIRERFPEVTLIKNKENLGFGKAINIALKSRESKYILLLNPDTEIRDKTFANIFKFLDQNPRVSVVGPMVLDYDGSIQGSARRFPTVLSSIFGRKSLFTKMFPNNPITKREFFCFNSDNKKEIDVDWVSGACMILRRKTIDQIGGFDERFFLYWEDTDLCKRIKETGRRVVYFPDATVFHSVGKSSRTNAIRSIYHFHRSCFILFLKYSKMPLKIFIPFAFYGLTARCLFVIMLQAINKTLKRLQNYDVENNSCTTTHCQPTDLHNTQKKILIINQYYPPDRSATADALEKIVEYLSKTFMISILAGRPSYLSLERHKWKPIYFLSKSKTKIVRVGSFVYPRKNKLLRSLNYLSYFFIATPIAMMIKADLIISMTDPPLSGIIGAVTAIIRKKPFIYYIQDLHPEMAIASGMIKSGIITDIWDSIHKFVMHHADKILVLGEDMRDKILKKGISGKKIAVIRHGTTNQAETDYIDEQVINYIRDQYHFIFMHAGNIGFYGAWENLIEAIKDVKDNNIGFIFVGEGQNKNKLMRQSNCCKNVKFIPYQPREKVKSVLEAGDVHIISIKKGLEGLVVPSKIYPIISSHKPILAICSENSDIARIVKRFKCGLVVDPDSKQEIIEAVQYFYRNRNKLSDYCNNAKIAKEFYQQEKQLLILENEIKSAKSC